MRTANTYRAARRSAAKAAYGGRGSRPTPWPAFWAAWNRQFAVALRRRRA